MAAEARRILLETSNRVGNLSGRWSALTSLAHRARQAARGLDKPEPMTNPTDDAPLDWRGRQTKEIALWP